MPTILEPFWCFFSKNQNYSKYYSIIVIEAQTVEVEYIFFIENFCLFLSGYSLLWQCLIHIMEPQSISFKMKISPKAFCIAFSKLCLGSFVKRTFGASKRPACDSLHAKPPVRGCAARGREKQTSIPSFILWAHGHGKCQSTFLIWGGKKQGEHKCRL